jgi:GAF domain-containing protein
VGQQAAAIKNLDELLPTITEFIRQRLNLYHTQVYFVDDVGENLVIRAGTGDVGQQLLARRHSLPIGPGSVVGQVAAEARTMVVADTAHSQIHRPSPLLPNTRSELAVPLQIENRVIGVLDMQADRENTFTERNQTVFEALATQLAIAVDSAQQWTQAQAAQQKAQEALRQLTRESWTQTLASRRGALGFAYNLSTVIPLTVEVDNKGVTVPVEVQNEPIGQLMVDIPPDRGLTADEYALMSAVAQQLGQKAENLRLFEQTQQRAAREQMARQIADKIRASRNNEAALKTAAAELSQALGASRTVVNLQVEATDGQE